MPILQIGVWLRARDFLFRQFSPRPISCQLRGDFGRFARTTASFQAIIDVVDMFRLWPQSNDTSLESMLLSLLLSRGCLPKYVF